MLARIRNHPFFHGSDHDLTIDGRGSKVYERFARLTMRGFYRHVAAEAAAAAPPGSAVLDVGTGPGLLLTELAGRRPDLRLTGIDLSADMVELATRNARRSGHADRTEIHQGDSAALPLDDATFDLVMATFCMHHWGAVPQAVNELARVLRPGGTLWIYDFRTVPDTPLTAAAKEAFPGQPLHRTLPRIGRLPIRLTTRWAVSRGDR
jgi:ubiquinone/menaquinone biosynthesis C-methylase UbiE